MHLKFENRTWLFNSLPWQYEPRMTMQTVIWSIWQLGMRCLKYSIRKYIIVTCTWESTEETFILFSTENVEGWSKHKEDLLQTGYIFLLLLHSTQCCSCIFRVHSKLLNGSFQRGRKEGKRWDQLPLRRTTKIG